MELPGESKVLDVPFGRMDSPISRGAGHNVWLLDRIRRGNRVYSAEPVREQAIKVCGYWRREDVGAVLVLGLGESHDSGATYKCCCF